MLAEARAIDRAAGRYPDVQVAIAPPFTLIGALREAVSAMGVGGQDCHTEVKGAHTGDVSAAMLVDTGADFAILGHSERRKDHGENDALVKAKAEAALTAGLDIIVCVGETLDQRDAGKAEAVVSSQVDGSLPSPETAAEAVAAGKVAVAYEPVWAIGTGRNATPQQAQRMHALMRGLIAERHAALAGRTRILYGGSVTPANAAEIFDMPDIDGGLIGRCSLDAQAFRQICQAAATSVAVDRLAT